VWRKTFWTMPPLFFFLKKKKKNFFLYTAGRPVRLFVRARRPSMSEATHTGGQGWREGERMRCCRRRGGPVRGMLGSVRIEDEGPGIEARTTCRASASFYPRRPEPEAARITGKQACPPFVETIIHGPPSRRARREEPARPGQRLGIEAPAAPPYGSSSTGGGTECSWR